MIYKTNALSYEVLTIDTIKLIIPTLINAVKRSYVRNRNIITKQWLNIRTPTCLGTHVLRDIS